MPAGSGWASDWLADHSEPGQTFEPYRRERVNRPGMLARGLYLQPLGEFPAATSPNLDQPKQFAEAFFTLPVELRPAVDLAGLPITSRTHPGTRQRPLPTSYPVAISGNAESNFLVLAVAVGETPG